MLTTLQTCGHCGQKVVFRMGELWEIGRAPIRSVDHLQSVRERERSYNTAKVTHSAKHIDNAALDEVIRACGLAVCTSCNEPSVIIFSMSRSLCINHRAQLRKDTSVIVDDDAGEHVVAMFPKPKTPEHDDNWPENIARKISEAQKMLIGGFSAPTIISTCRTTLELITKNLNGQGKSIFDRVEDLFKQGVITKPIATWAHDLRKYGANATHDDEGTDEDARAFVQFLLTFLHVAYTLPASIEARKRGQDIFG